MRAKVVLMSESGMTNSFIARELEVSRPTVILWLKRFRSMGIKGILGDKKRSVEKRVLTSEKIKEVVEATFPQSGSVLRKTPHPGVLPIGVLEAWPRQKD